MKLAEMCKQVEKSVHDGRLGAAGDQLATLRSEYGKAEHALRERAHAALT
jgi:hypothetical protein